MNQNNINVFTCPRNRNTMSKQASLGASPTSGLALKTAFASGLSGCLACHGLSISRRILSPRPWQVSQGVRECTKCRSNHNHCRAHCTAIECRPFADERAFAEGELHYGSLVYPLQSICCDGLSDSEENFFIWHNTMQAVRFETYVA